MESYFSKNYDSLKYPKSKGGLRNAQLGALHSVASHFTTKSSPAIIVMPTGSGKTAVLMATPFCLSSNRVLIITPSRLVREQIAEEFKKIKLLKSLGVLSERVSLPKVHEIKKRITSRSQWDELKKYDVVVALPSSISPKIKQIPDPPTTLFDLVLIDEAHHSPARTWSSILSHFKQAKQILFTATPFRRDKKEIKGSFVYNYPISQAYKDGIFGNIEFIPISPHENINVDTAIAKKAEKELLNDRRKGYNHALMIRTDGKERAKELFQIYQKETALKIRTVDSSKSLQFITRSIKDLKDGVIDGVICVNMMGEGFDFPNLKIAAIHAPHKSLEVTLQFVGRFARTNIDKLGKAKFIACEDENFKLQKKNIFSSSAVWQEIFEELSQGRISDEIDVKDKLLTFDNLESQEEEPISLYALNPYFHFKVYEIKENIDLNKFDIKAPAGYDIYQEDYSKELSTRVLIFYRQKRITWIQSYEKYSSHYELVILLTCEVGNRKFLFINSTKRTNEFYDFLKRQIASDARDLSVETLEKVFLGLKDMRQINTGSRNMSASADSSYTVRMGSNPGKATTHEEIDSHAKGHCFIKGYEDKGGVITIGYSGSSKIWSHNNNRIPVMIDFCNKYAKKMCSDKTLVPLSNFDKMTSSKTLTEIKNKIVAVDWNIDIYKHSSRYKVLLNEKEIDLLHIDLSVKHDGKSNSVQISLISELLKNNYDYNYKLLPTPIECKPVEKDKDIEVVDNNTGEIVKISDLLKIYPPTFYTSNIEIIVGNTIANHINFDRLTINPDIFNPFEWEENNIDVFNEIKTLKEGKYSIHNYLIKTLSEDKKVKFLFYDHGQGEIADIITASIDEQTKDKKVCLYHCKAMSKKSKQKGLRLDDVYEICGQAIKSKVWLNNTFLLDRIRSRNNGKRLKKGSIEGLEKILNSDLVRFEVIIVQPGLSKAKLLQSSQQGVARVLQAATDFIGHQHDVNFLIST